MTVTVLLFASYADAVGRSEIELEVETGTKVQDVIDQVRALGKGEGDIERLPRTPVVAVNEEYASRDHELSDGDEVALIPPVAGG